METSQSKSRSQNRRIGCVVGFVLFLYGFIPSTLLGYQCGRALSEVLLDHSIKVDTSLLSKFFVYGGMGVGFVLGLLVCVLIGVLIAESVEELRSGVQKRGTNT